MNRLLLLFAVVALAGCRHHTYTIDLTPAGAEMERAFTVSMSDNSGTALGVPLEELERLAAIYNAEVKDRTVTTATFAAKFGQAMPQDIGGAGTHAAFATSLGTFHVYSERFRGQDDLLAQWEQKVAAVDLLVDLSIGWADETLRGEAGLGTLHDFLDHDFRRDLKNALLYFHWSGISLDHSDTVEPDEVEARMIGLVAMTAQYLQARGYFEVDDLPHLYAAGVSDDSDESALTLLRRQILRRMGRDPAGPLPATLAAIDSRDAWGDSVVKYTQTDDDARARIDRWTAAWRPENAEDGGDHLGLATTDLIDLRFFEDFDRLELRLHPDHKPFATNGRWDATANTVTWSRTLNASAEDSTGLPVTAVALWCEPDAAEQGRRLGTIGLVDEDLASYCLQRLALPRSQSEEWESFLSSLGPGEQPGARLRAFRFKGHERDDTPPGIADVVASSLHP